MTAIVILGWIDFEPGDRERWLDHSYELTKATLEEPGCLRHVIVADPHSPTALITQAHYVDQAAFDAHAASAHFARFRLATEHCRVRVRNVDRFEARKIN